MSHKPVSALKTIPLIWPFAVWGLDMVGPLWTGRSGFTHVLVAVDKFTKMIEAKPIKNLDASTAVSFIREITFKYGVPTASSLTTVQTLILMSSGLFVLHKVLKSTMPQSPTPSRMDRLKEQMD